MYNDEYIKGKKTEADDNAPGKKVFVIGASFTHTKRV